MTDEDIQRHDASQDIIGELGSALQEPVQLLEVDGRRLLHLHFEDRGGAG